MSYLVQRTISFLLNLKDYKPFVTVTADELVFGYDDTLVSLAHSFYPKRKRPMSRMGLLINVSSLGFRGNGIEIWVSEEWYFE